MRCEILIVDNIRIVIFWITNPRGELPAFRYTTLQLHHNIPVISQYEILMSVIVQQDATITVFYISANCSKCFGCYLHPSSGAHVDCNYSIWHWSNRICYRSLSWRSRKNSFTTADGSKYGSASAIRCN